MGSAIVKQRTERHKKSKSSSRIERISKSDSAQDKNGQLYLNEESRSNTDLDLSSRSCQQVYSNGEDISPSQEHQKSWSEELSNRKKKRLHQRLRRMKFFTRSNEERCDDVSFLSLEASSNQDSKKSMSQNCSETKKSLVLQSETPSRSFSCSQGDSHCIIVQRRHNNLFDKSKSMQPQAVSEEPGVTSDIKEGIVSPSINTTKESKNGDLECKDVCRDARTPSPQFDELENVVLMSCNSVENKETVLRCSSLDCEESGAENTGEGSHGIQMIKQCKNPNLHIIDLCETKCNHVPTMECHTSRTYPVRENIAAEQTPPSQRHPKLDAIGFSESSELFMDSPTVNHPVVENVLASGDDYVDSLDEKFVMRGNLSVQDLDDHLDEACDSLSEGQNGRRDSIEGQSPHEGEKPESPFVDDVYGGQRNNSQTANYSDWPYKTGLSLEKIECIQRQVYQEGLAPMRADGGVAFFVPVEENGMQPPTGKANVNYPSRLKVSRKSGLSYEERRILADVNRTKQLDKRKEFAVRQNKSVVGKYSNPNDDDDSIFDIDTHSLNGDPCRKP